MHIVVDVQDNSETNQSVFFISKTNHFSSEHRHGIRFYATKV